MRPDKERDKMYGSFSFFPLGGFEIFGLGHMIEKCFACIALIFVPISKPSRQDSTRFLTHVQAYTITSFLLVLSIIIHLPFQSTLFNNAIAASYPILNLIHQSFSDLT